MQHIRKLTNNLLKVFTTFAIGLAVTHNAQATNLTVNIKQQQIDNCIAGTLRYNIADKKTANKLCVCTIGVRSQMTIGQMWEIESYAQSDADPSELPYVIKLQNDLQQCTVGLNLKSPVK